MAKYYAPVFSEQDLVNMDKFKATMKLSVDNQPTTPLSVRFGQRVFTRKT